MRIRHIEVFHAVYSSGSVTQAARMLNVSQPSVSKVLSHAESQLGFNLFERSGGRLKPTPEAERLFEHVSKLFDEIGAVRRVANNLRDLGDGQIKLASTPAMAMDLLPAVVASFLEAFPGIYFELETLHYSELVSALVESRIDVALAFDPPSQAGIAEIPIAKGEFVLIKPPGTHLPDSSSIELSQLTSLPLIRLNNRGPLGQLLDAYIEESDVSFNVVAATETYHIAKSLVAHGVGVSIVDEFTARARDDMPVDILPLHNAPNFEVSALHLENAPVSQAAANFISHAQAKILALRADP